LRRLALGPEIAPACALRIADESPQPFIRTREQAHIRDGTIRKSRIQVFP
jgi:hypothetical protein